MPFLIHFICNVWALARRYSPMRQTCRLYRCSNVKKIRCNTRHYINSSCCKRQHIVCPKTCSSFPAKHIYSALCCTKVVSCSCRTPSSFLTSCLLGLFKYCPPKINCFVLLTWHFDHRHCCEVQTNLCLQTTPENNAKL